KDEEATRETIVDGWLHSGDIGELDDGFLKITDRKKDLIITAGGKNVAPQRIERILKLSPYISQAAAYGDKRRYVTALVTLDREAILPWAADNGL
ncbi:MAG: AMP-binding protein, partial [Acidobacteria bacterium]|nr:AMP-binding protein [Acidobacteriota bacterium]NIQ85654.1 AMP-binding protein [Acidobacteriota bacterium]